MSDLQPYGYFGRSGGMSTLIPPEFVPPGSWVDLYNCVVDGGKITPRPGLVKATDTPLSAVTTVQGGLNLPNKLVVNTAPGGTSSDIIYFVGGIGSSYYVRKVNANGSGASQLFSNNVPFRGIDLDTIPNPDRLYLTRQNRIDIANADGSGSVTTLINTTGQSLSSLCIWPSSGVIYFINATILNTGGIWRCSMSGTAETYMQPLTYSNVNFPAITIDRVNGYLYTGIGSFDTQSVPQIRRYTITGSETPTSFQSSARSYDRNYFITAMHYDATEGRLYWTEADYAYAQFYVRSGVPVESSQAGKLLMNDERTHYVFPGDIAIPGIFNDSTGGVMYMTQYTASGAVISAASDVIADNAYWWNRSLIGISSPNTVGDAVLVQVRNRRMGGSTMKTWFPASGTVVDMQPGFTPGTDINKPDVFVMLSRTANPAPNDQFLPPGNFSRISCDYMGGGFDSLQGGVLIGTTQGSYVWNYRAPETTPQNAQQLLYIVGAPTGGSFRLILNIAQLGPITYSTTPSILAANIQTALNAALGSGSVVATATNFPNLYDSTSPSPIAIDFVGNGYDDRGLPYLRPGTNSLTGGTHPSIIVRRSNDLTTRGRSYRFGALFLRPTGLPAPASAPTLAVVAGGGGGGGPVQSISGYYEYAISYYSTQLKLESPLSKRVTISPSDQFVQINWTLPATNYFTLTTFSTPRFDGGPLIDKVRIWRRRLGVSPNNSTGRDSFLYLVEEVPANYGAFIDRRSESGVNALDRGRIYMSKEYPPSNCQYVAVHDNHAYYADGEPGSRLLWVSNGPYIGGVSGGENGHEYVDPASYYILDDVTPNDHQITAVKSFGPALVIWTDSACFIADTFDVDNTGLAVRKLANATGCASHWCIVSSEGLPALPGGVLIYPNPRGSLYIFDGQEARSIGREALRPYIDAFSQVTWKNIQIGSEAVPSWYNATAVLDPNGNRILLTAPLADGDYETYVYCFDDTGWVRWNLKPNLLFLGRETSMTDSVGLGTPTVYVGLGNSLAKLRNGRGDLGAPFEWHALTGKLHAEMPYTGKFWGNGIVLARTVSYGIANTLTVTGYADGAQIFSVDRPLPGGDSTIPFSAHKGLARYMQLKLSGTLNDGQDRPEILGYYVWQAPSGVDGRVRP